MATTVPCPACWHHETIQARTEEREPIHDDPALMRWVRTGYWVCQHCYLTLDPRECGILLDAAIRQSDPTTEGYEEQLVPDARRALRHG